MKLPHEAIKGIIVTNLIRHEAMRDEVEAIIAKSEKFMVTMFAKDIGLELDQVVTYCGELAIIDRFIIDETQQCGFKIEVISYLDADKHAVVTLDQIKL